MTITRTAYCPQCAQLSRPLSGDFFLLHGRDSKTYRVEQCDHHVSGKVVGYTPHLFTKLKVDNGMVVVQKVCAMNGCGVVLYETKEGFEFTIRYQSIYAMTVKDWNALVKATNLGYEL